VPTPGPRLVEARRHKAAFATIDGDGFPHVVGMNYFVKDGAFYNAYSELRGVMVRGHCEIGRY
jgi:hypothetical protein